MTNKDMWMWAGIAAGAAVLVYMNQSGILPAPATATPLSVYPEFGYTAQATTTMAATPQQQTTAPLPPTPQFTSVQAAQQNAILAQCVSANVCSPLTGDTQLGL